MNDASPSAEQKAAIEHPARTLVCIAGAGSGKTKTLIWRIQHDIAKGAAPARMAVITFTGAGAAEVKRRLAVLDVNVGFVGTLHAFCLRLLNHIYGKPLTVLDEDASEQVMLYSMERAACEVPIAKLKEWLYEGKSPTDKIKTVAAVYTRILSQYDAIDYGLILKCAASMLQNGFDPGVDSLYVDEFQDSGPIDLEIYDAIDANKFIVGDPDQSIYGFRGACPSNIFELMKREGTFTVRLTDTYRCWPAICDAANNLIAHNKVRVPKSLKPTHDGPGEVVTAAFDTHIEELAWLIHHVKGEPHPHDVAVLVRYNDERKRITSALTGAGVPVNGCIDEEKPGDWKHAVAILTACANPTNVFAAAHLATFSGIEFRTALAFAIVAAQKGQALDALPQAKPDVFKMLLDRGISDPTRRMIFEIADAAEAMTLRDIVLALKTDESPNRIADGVSVLTYHGAKGMEWARVYLPASEDGTLARRKLDALPEERRCYFVALTRAQARVSVTWAASRDNPFTKRPEPTGGVSRFVVELQRPAAV